MTKSNKMKEIIKVILSLVIIFILNLDYSIIDRRIIIGKLDFISTFVQLIGSYYLINELINNKNKNKKMIIFSATLGIIFTFMCIFRVTNFVNVMMEIPGITKRYIVYSILKFLAVSIIITSIVIKSFNILEEKMGKGNTTNEESKVIMIIEKYFLGKGIISIILITIAIGILYLPYFLNYYPRRSS